MLAFLLACGSNVTTDLPANTDTEDTDTGGFDIDGDGDGVYSAEDCNDGDHTIYPGADEICDGEDNNCNDAVDEGVSTTVYTDGDGDGYGDDDTSVEGCDGVAGMVAVGGDCDDTRTDVSPDGVEVCDSSSTDEDCDGLINDADSDVDVSTMSSGYLDNDGDGYGDDDAVASACSLSESYIAIGGDCDDSDAFINPGEPEICDDDAIDEDCNGFSDDDDPDLDPEFALTWYPDADGDGFGDSASEVVSCSAVSGYIEDGTDCDDTDPDENPVDGCDWDGAYTGTVFLTADWSGLTDTCTGTAAVDVDDEAEPQLEGTLSCTWTGFFSHIFGPITGTLEGEMIDVSDAEGEMALSTKLIEGFTGVFTAPGNLTIEMSGKGKVLTYDMTLDLAR
ncbi:MAG: hypothetical protein ACI8RZ_001746 [Myxococcota bacterium]|jgi:hypothetical protein